MNTEAWVLYAGDTYPDGSRPKDKLKNEQFSFETLRENEVLVAPIYGCWEGNMGHAVQHKPIDVCRERNEERVVIGNAGVVKVLEIGSTVTTVQRDDYAILFCNGVADIHGYPEKILGYDAPNTMGILAKQVKLDQYQLIAIPQKQPSKELLQQWAAFSLRYITAWANWRVAFQCWRAQMQHVPPDDTYVFAWGGGVSLGELQLARLNGCQTFMLSSKDEEIAHLQSSGINAIDRRPFIEMNYAPDKYVSDKRYRDSYKKLEEQFLAMIAELTAGQGASIFIDNIGVPVARVTLKALGRQGVITTSGWKLGMEIMHVRAIECISRHIHVHTHYATYQEGLDAVKFAAEHDWLPPVTGSVSPWDAIPQLVEDYLDNRVTSYFPIFEVNGFL